MARARLQGADNGLRDLDREIVSSAFVVATDKDFTLLSPHTVQLARRGIATEQPLCTGELVVEEAMKRG
jgi:hypothetical protein